MSERWKTVPGYEGVEASSQGRVRQDGEIRPQSLTGKGYLVGRGYFATRIRGKLTKIHRLVATAFHRTPKAGEECNHKDGSTTNNKPRNLEWTTNSGNQKHAIAIGLKIVKRGQHVGSAKLTEEKARRIIATKGIVSCYKLAPEIGISATQIKRIRRGESWQHLQHNSAKR